MMQQTLMLEAALGYAQLGIAVLPMRTGEKIPQTCHGSRDASKDPGQISRWWGRWPKSDLALACGMISGFDALDVDRQHGGIEALAELIDVHGALPETSRQQTPSGGFHLLFRHRPGLKNRSGGQGCAPLGLDCRTSGAMIKAAPAPGYRWTRFLDPASLPPWPDWLAVFYLDDEGRNPARFEPPAIALATPAQADQAVRYVAGAIAGIAEEIACAVPGCQQATLNGASFRAGRLHAAAPTLSLDEIAETLVAAGLAMANQPGRRPWRRAEIERIVQRALDDGRQAGPARLPLFEGI
ncbi:MAG: bifunctional DNA primase/polymerase [Rhizobiales bacterium]|nr:bifunctional DNA primase/polymerase [Hyphomicrobiales bacterium]